MSKFIQRSKELILIETSQPQQVKKLLEKAHIDYKVYQEPKKTAPVNIFTNYDINRD